MLLSNVFLLSTIYELRRDDGQNLVTEKQEHVISKLHTQAKITWKDMELTKEQYVVRLEEK